jgi:hypothetical protein
MQSLLRWLTAVMVEWRWSGGVNAEQNNGSLVFPVHAFDKYYYNKH